MADRRDHQRDALSNAGIHQAPEGSSSRSDARIARLAERVGNDTIQDRIHQGNASRDQMLDHVCDRLKTMHTLQQRELALTQRGSHFEWWRTAADSHKPDWQEPRPMRWNEAARLYEDAAHHLCRGDLQRGRELLERAMQEEQRARDTMTRLVDTVDLDEGAIQSRFAPVPSTEVAGACDLPDDVRLAREIYNVESEGPTVPNRGRPADPWWTLEEEPEDEPGEAGT